jgi:hypothetical protein
MTGAGGASGIFSGKGQIKYATLPYISVFIQLK